MASENARIFIDKGSISLLFSAKAVILHTVMDKNIKNIIFDLGGVLVGLNPERCINAFREIGCGVLASYVEEHRTEDLFLETELGRIGEGEFCNEVRRIAHTDTPDKDIVWAWNQLLTGIPHEKLLRLARLKQQGFCCRTPTQCIGTAVATTSSRHADCVPLIISNIYSYRTRCTWQSQTWRFSTKLLPLQASMQPKRYSSTTARPTASLPRRLA